MHGRRLQSQGLLLALLFVLGHSSFVRSQVVVTLREQASVSARTATIADVAELSGGQAALRERIGRLDLAELPQNGLAVSVPRKQVLFRIRLEDYSESQCIVQGADVVRVSGRFRTVSVDEVVSASRAALYQVLPWSPGEVRVDLAQPVSVPLPQVGAEELVVIKAEPHAGQRGPGRVQMNVKIFVRGESRLALAVHFDVKPCVRVVVCRRRIEKGEALNESNVFVDTRPVDSRSPMALNPESMSGKKARQSLMPGLVIQSTEVEGGDDSNAVLIKSQDGVRIQVRVGGLRVSATGQALQDGQRGQLIRVQNMESKKVLLGRVVERGLVEIE